MAWSSTMIVLQDHVGTMKFKMFNGALCSLGRVHASKMRWNLTSVETLDFNGL